MAKDFERINLDTAAKDSAGLLFVEPSNAALLTCQVTAWAALSSLNGFACLQ